MEYSGCSNREGDGPRNEVASGEWNILCHSHSQTVRVRIWPWNKIPVWTCLVPYRLLGHITIWYIGYVLHNVVPLSPAYHSTTCLSFSCWPTNVLWHCLLSRNCICQQRERWVLFHQNNQSSSCFPCLFDLRYLLSLPESVYHECRVHSLHNHMILIDTYQ